MPKNSILYINEPEWIFNQPGIRQRMPINVQSWVYEPDSLTQRIRHYHGDSFAVNVLFHQWRKPFLSECLLLPVEYSQYCLIREVMLTAGKTPLILARTIIPRKTLQGAQRSLSRLGNRPLGEVIFSYPKLQRLEMEISSVAPTNWMQEIKNKINLDHPIWGRRTIYSIQNRHMLVTEFFLPDVLEIL